MRHNYSGFSLRAGDCASPFRRLLCCRSFQFRIEARPWIGAAQQAACVFGKVFEVEPGQSRGEGRFRNGFRGGGRRGGRVRLQRPALQESVLKIRRSPRFAGHRAIPALIFSRAGITALWRFYTGDMHRFSSSCGHEQGLKSHGKRVQTISGLCLQKRSIWRAGRPRRPNSGSFEISAAPLPAPGIPAPPYKY